MLEPYYCITCLYQKQFYVGLVYIRVAAGAESPVSVPPAMYPAEYPAAAVAASFSVPVAPVVPSAAVGWWGRGWVVGYSAFAILRVRGLRVSDPRGSRKPKNLRTLGPVN